MKLHCLQSSSLYILRCQASSALHCSCCAENRHLYRHCNVKLACICICYMYGELQTFFTIMHEQLDICIRYS